MHYNDSAALRTLLAADPAAFAAAVLRALDLPVTGITHGDGWSNSVWLSAHHVVRLSSGRFRDSLAYEAAVLKVLPEDVPHAQVIAVGTIGHREWMVQERVPGSTWRAVWPHLSVAERCSAIEQLGRAQRAWHAMQLPTGLDNPWLADALAPEGHPEDAYHAPPQDYRVLLTAAHRLPNVDHALLDAVGAFIAERLGAFASDAQPHALVHGDLHWSNLLWHDGRLTAVLDWEGSRRTAPDQELDTLLRFVREPALYSAPAEAGGLAAASLRDVPGWLARIYPELFAHSRLVERLEAYEAMWQLVSVFHFAPGSGLRDPWARLHALLSHGNAVRDG